MKMVIITLIISLFTSVLKAPSYPSGVILQTEVVRPYEAIWNATCKVESNFNPFAIGDKHLKEFSYGIVQVRKARLSDYYAKTGVMYSEIDMFNPAKAKQVFMYYCQSLDIERISREWNGGAKGMTKKSTLIYWGKIQKAL
jgi:hypothetical protein